MTSPARIAPLAGDRFIPDELARALDQAGERLSISGVGEGALAFLAALLPHLAGRPLAVIVPTRGDAEPLLHDIQAFATALGVLSVEPALLPALEPEPYLGVAPHLQVIVDRATALHDTRTGSNPLVVIPAEALLLRTPSPEVFHALTRTIGIDDEIDRDDLVQDLVRAGYRRQDLVGSVGELSVRGGILDIYSPAETSPCRLELFGDTVESIRRFDPVSQRSEGDTDQAVLLPLVPFPLPRDADRLLRDWGEGLDEGQRDDLRSKRELVKESGSFPGWEYFAPVLAAPLVDLTAYLEGYAIAVVEPDSVAAEFEKARAALEQVHREVVERRSAVPVPDELALTPDEASTLLDRADLHIQALTGEARPGRREVPLGTQPQRRYEGRIKELVRDLERDRKEGLDAAVVVPSQAEAERVEAMLSEYELSYLEGERANAVWSHDPAPAGDGRIAVVTGRLGHGFRSPDLGLSIYAAPEVFGTGLPPARRRRRSSAAFASDFRDLKTGDHVVHVDHGVARFAGLKTIEVADVSQECMVLEFSEEGKVYVPLHRLDQVQKYSGVEGMKPRVDSLGGTSWAKVKKKIKADLREIASELLNLYAQRKVMQGHAFAPDGLFQQEFEDAFAFNPTPDQLTTIADIKRDMESDGCMDRLLCGDVGFGKTEVGMRAAFKAVADGKQVAVLAPTTVLAFQHQQTFSARFAPFPVEVEMISRFRSKKEVDDVLKRTAEGTVDILIGNHKILGKAVKFRDLGLLVIDEEQRFGVSHKEKLKQLRKGVDVLTLSATPIPRTLQMSLAGMRDMSVIETPPKDRLAIETSVVPFGSEVIKEGIKRELERGGQVFFVHNRVESIYAMADALRQIAPFARVAVGHGQMREGELEKVMLGFMKRDFDVLLATTIIENGLDMPNVNTIFINRAHRLGLSQLYQLRGRVGRSDRAAYAFLITPGRAKLTPVARRRLHAIQEFSELGSGFRIAALDLEIRGAGNLLGKAQSGHIASVGFDMFMELLEQTVREIKGEVVQEVTTQLNLGLDVSIPLAFMPDSNQRLMLYKRIAGAKMVVEVDDLEKEAEDRFGKLPASVTTLFESARLKIEAQALGIPVVERLGKKGILRLGEHARLDPQSVVAFASAAPKRKVHPDGRITFEVSANAECVEELRIVLAELA